MLRIVIFGYILLKVVFSDNSLENFEDTISEDKTCGQTPCPPPGDCCIHSQNCCCVSSPAGESFTCKSNHIDSHGWSMPWWGSALVIVGVVAIVSAIVFVCYRRKKRQSYGEI